MASKNDLERYAEKLIWEKDGLLPSDRRSTHQTTLLDELHQTLHRKLMTRLHRDQQIKVNKLLHAGKPHLEIQRFIIEQIPDAATYLTHVLLHFRIAFLSKSYGQKGK